MSLSYDDIRYARQQAIADIDRADEVARQAAELIVNRLRIAKVDRDTLAALKRELQDFNAVTRRWKPRK